MNNFTGLQKMHLSLPNNSRLNTTVFSLMNLLSNFYSN